MPSERLTALVTGASYGIGREIALACARRGHDLVLVARSRERLDQLAEESVKSHAVRAHVVECDLQGAGGPERVLEATAGLGASIDILVNNAGYGTHGPFAESDIAKELGMIDLNVRALTHLTRLFLPSMLARKRGRILNVASTAGFQPGPLMAVYYATKAYALHFSEALAEELAGSGVTVTALCPGPTASEFQERAGIGESRLAALGMMDSRSVAEVGYLAMMAGKTIAVPGFRNKLGVLLVRTGPRALVRKFVKRLNSNR